MSSGRIARLAAGSAVLATAVSLAADRADAHTLGVKVSIRKRVLTITGDARPQSLVLSVAGGRLRVDAGDDGRPDFAVELAAFRSLVADAGGGDDAIRVDDRGVAFRFPTTLAGGAGDDRIDGGAAAETLAGGDGTDVVDGGRGNDVALLGAGGDVFTWNPGDGSDRVEGETGADALVFNGSADSEVLDLAARGSRLRLTRNVGAVAMDLGDIELLRANPLGGADTLNLHDTRGTALTDTQVDLTGSLGGIGADGAHDAVTADGSGARDAVQATGQPGIASVAGLAARLRIEHADASDDLALALGGGDDALDATAVTAPALRLTADGGAGNDALLGGQGADRLLGGDGNDAIDGGLGNDAALMGAGDDTFTWDPGEGSDTVDGQAGTDALRFNGANADESVDISANAGRVRFLRSPGNVALDLDDVERIDHRLLGGADDVVVGDLSPTDVKAVDDDLGSDGAADRVTVRATSAGDVATVSGSAGAAAVEGLPARVTLTGAEPGNDALRVDLLGGDDVGNASDLAATVLKLTLAGGDGNDLLIGSAGNDALLGEAGDDVLIGGPGQDTLDGGTGDNVVIQD